MTILIDNYDSFTYNLYQLLGLFDDVQTIRNDAVTVEELEALQPDRIVLSPGPGRPADAGICEAVIRHFSGRVPILGVCLGHQAICEVAGGTITYARELMHGKQSVVQLAEGEPLFRGLGRETDVGRYHSLAVDTAGKPEGSGTDAGRRSHGCPLRPGACIRPAVSSRIDPDPTGSGNDRKFHAHDLLRRNSSVIVIEEAIP